MKYKKMTLILYTYVDAFRQFELKILKKHKKYLHLVFIYGFDLGSRFEPGLDDLRNHCMELIQR